jgi:hypothetical protein
MMGSRQRLARQRELLVATAQLQRMQLRLALRQGPWPGALGAARIAWAVAPLLAELWQRRRARRA